MYNRFETWLNRQPPGRRRLYIGFIALILLTLPCYCLGSLVLFVNTPPSSPEPVPTAGIASVTPQETATEPASATPRARPSIERPTLPPPLTDQPTRLPSLPPPSPTATPIETPTLALPPTPLPTNTLPLPTATPPPAPTATSVPPTTPPPPTNTSAPAPTATAEPPTPIASPPFVTDTPGTP